MPFCKSKCLYCDFYSVVPSQTEKYFQKVCTEIERWGRVLSDRIVNTIYFGGGTPSLLECDNICDILNAIYNNFKISNNKIEITIEINPADYKLIDFEKLKFHGVNRISVGAQSLNDSEFKTLGRRHNVEDIFSTYNQIKESGIKNISFDAILGIPNQTQKSIDDFLNFCKYNQISHISAYLLKIEEGTQFYKNQKTLNFPSEDESAEIYMHVCEVLKKCGYNHYEISNFSVPGFESQHNLKYWNLDEYLGIGPSAHSLINNARFCYSNNINKFINHSEILSEGKFEPEKEYAMLRLRLFDGLKNELYRKKFGKDIPEIYSEKTQKYNNLGLIECNNVEIRLTEKGFLLSNAIISDILM